MVYKLSKLGIGDIFLFSLEMRKKNIKDLKINIDLKTLSIYRSNTPNYINFVTELIEFLFQDIPVEFVNNTFNQVYNEDWSVIHNSLNTPEICEYYKNIFKKDVGKIEDEYYVLFTKIRDYRYKDYLNIKTEFFNTLNNNNKKILLLGEKEIEYGVEYKLIGESSVYSIYNDIINNINHDLIVDKTIPKMGITLPDLNSIINDMNLIYNSKQTIMIGRGGFFCLSLPTNKLISLHSEGYSSILPNINNQGIFLDSTKFFKILKNDTNI